MMPQLPQQLLENGNFSKFLIDALPWGILIVNEEGIVHSVNRVLEQTFSISEKSAIGKVGGNAFGCLHARENPDDCCGETCRECEVRNLAFAALSSQRKQKARTRLRLVVDGQIRDLTMMITAIPIFFEGQKYAALIIQDISGLSELPIRKQGKGFRGIIGDSDKMQGIFDIIKQIAPINAPVLVQGESGTGKELVATAIHKESDRANKNFVPFNCGALPDGLIESELFGHVKGAFTGSIRDKKGRFELADGGTIFLDEVGELKPSVQVKLLRVLQEGRFERLGDEKSINVNVRVLSATNRNLQEEVLAGRFRKDLFYRLCVMPIIVPPLRDRREDIPLLVDYFTDRYAKEYGCERKPMSSSAISLLEEYEWPGNVRELQNIIQYALVRSRGPQIETRHLPPALEFGRGDGLIEKRVAPKLTKSDVIQALKETDGNKKEAAKALGVSRSTLYRFFDKHETSLSSN